ncbi:MAG: TlpA family protein disulfide reductase [Propionivibrio sp.]|uniref:TlpA family protein disulfide reductase n=2 Tax=Propionivibrio sp. TaxID=2212460 RepID=UPI0025E6D18C|nr:TlpA disulfide reductase family protein [Propionivibrio sp.]MBK8894833.1 TlpA family protein disulfide reductase [Propionivibrio sp.]
MKSSRMLALALLTGVATLATVALLVYRLWVTAQPPASSGIPPGLLASQQLSPEGAQKAVDRLFSLTLPDLAGQPQAIAQWRGKVLVVNYWASWCAPCVKEMPVFSRMHAHYSGWGVQFVGIGLDDAEKIRAFAKSTPVSYPLLVSDFSSQSSVLEIKGLPLTLVIGRDGRLEMTHLGPLDEATLEPVLKRLIGP